MTLHYRPIRNELVSVKQWDRYVADPERDVLFPFETRPSTSPGDKNQWRSIPSSFLAKDWPGLTLYYFAAYVGENEPGLSMSCLLARAATPQQAFHFKLLMKSLSPYARAIIRWHETLE